MLNKKCKKCGLYSLKRNGTRNGKQKYKCNRCGYVFQNKSRKRVKNIWLDYTEGKQTYAQLSKKYGISIPTVKSRLDTFKVKNFVS